MKTKWKLVWLVSVSVFIISLLQSVSLYAAMEDYCVVPPYVKRDVSVNIMILMDNSNDMKNSAYDHDNDTDWDDSKYTPNATYDNYYGYFDPRGCYAPPGAASTNFKRVGAVNYTTYETGCPPPGVGFNTYGKKLFNGNILNWALMSKLSIMKKVIMGGKFEPRPDSPQRITFEGSDWVAGSIGCKWTITGGSTFTISDKGVPEPCNRYEKGTWNNIKIDITSENTRGVFQEFTDNYTGMTNSPPPDGNFDKNSPRFGLEDFGSGGVPVRDQTIPPNTYNDWLTDVQNAPNRDSHPLATAHKDIIDYFDEESPTTGTDPYKSCVSYESPCISPAPCRKSFILMITSGADVSGTTVTSLPTECSSTETRPLVRNACYAYNTDLRSSADLPGKQNLSTYAVQTFGTSTGLITSCDTLTGNAKVLCDAAVAGGGQYYQAGIDDLDDVLRQALQDIIKRAAAGTAASVLASGEGSGANLIQAVFYPRRKFENTEIAWIGRLTNFWYYVDPYFTNSNIREDTTHDYILNLTNDYITQLYYDSTAEATKAKRWQDTDGDGDADTAITPDIEFENLTSLWEAGKLLWSRNPSTRTIKTTIGSGLIDFSTDNTSTLRSYLQAGSDNEASQIISYVKGYDKFCSISITTPCTQDSNCPSGETCVQTFRNRTVTIDGSSGVWKLGDILNSTPKIASWLPLNTYNKVYGDGTYGLPGADAALGDPDDPTHFLTTSEYKSRGMVFAGGNDGMLHAFKLGTLELKWTGQGTYEKARLTGSDLGKEMWAFIPKNALPYLKYTTDTGYCHIYSVDLTPYIFDASISGNPDDTKTVNSWRTILIGGMRYGGACRNLGSTCTDCVKTPIDGVGYSSYFALDITDQNNPQLLWEFSNENLGFTTTGPAVVRINATGDPTGKNKNGHWFVVFGSGPAGPISTSDQQFLGLSDQPLKFFVIGPLSATPGLPTVTPLDPSPSIPNAFAGSMLNSTMDTDLDYQDDAIYIGYVKRTGTSPNYTWTDGGVGRLLTKEDTSPSNWVWSKVIDGIGPVTSAVVRLQHQSKGILWLFFGTGRYYFEQAATVDDQNGQRQLFGVKEPCFSSTGFASSCSSPVSFCSSPCTGSPICTDLLTPLTCGDLTNVADISKVPTEATANATSFKGWYINLDASSGSYRAERVITDPMAASSGLVFFTTYKPYSDVCSFGGKSFIWAVKYDTGGCASALLKGKALLQVSTGSIEQMDLSSAFTEKGGRRTSAMEGVPPTAQGLSLISTPPPVKRVLHIRER